MENVIGESAGIVWKVLRTKGPMPRAKLTKETRLSNEMTSSAVGWLAREGKLDFGGGRNPRIGLRDGTGVVEKES